MSDRFPAARLCLVALSCVALLGCKDPPKQRAAFEATPARAKIVEHCGLGLVDDDGRACVQIDVISEGSGPEAAEGDWLRIHYIVELPNGTALDSSHERKPLAVQLGRSRDVIEGMHLGLAGMRVGELRRFWVPPKLGYRGQKLPGVPPDADLTFLVELVELTPKA